MFGRKKKYELSIYPDEIFIDAKNIPGFERERFEGTIEKPISGKSFWGLGIFFAAVILIFAVKIFSLQVVYGESFALRSENNRLRKAFILPNRGIIYDRNGKKLAWNGVDSRSYSKLPGLDNAIGYVGFPSRKDVHSEKELFSKEMVGKDGIEKEYNNILKGKAGLKLMETDSKGKLVSESIQRNPQNGQSVILSIDADVQSKFFKILKSVADERDFLGGAGLLIDIKNGEILSMVTYPEYNSAVLSQGGPKEEIKKLINNKDKPFLNRAISGLYSPGSIIKPLMAVAALNEHVISPEKKIFSSGKITLPNPYFPDKINIFWDWKAHGWVDMRRALAVSSNVYFYEIGGGFKDQQGLGITRIMEYAKKFGLGLLTGIDLNGEKKGLVPSPEWKKNNASDPIWRIGDTYNTSIGQGFFQVTPIQMAVYVSAVANGGTILRPHLLRYANKQSPPIGARKLNIPEKYFKIPREGMRMSVLLGTSSGLNISSVKIGAKTGTAQVGISKKRVNSWVMGFFPYDKPRFAFVVVMEKGPSKNLVGGLYVARQLFDWMSVNAPEYLR